MPSLGAFTNQELFWKTTRKSLSLFLIKKSCRWVGKRIHLFYLLPPHSMKQNGWLVKVRFIDKKGSFLDLGQSGVNGRDGVLTQKVPLPHWDPLKCRSHPPSCPNTALKPCRTCLERCRGEEGVHWGWCYISGWLPSGFCAAPEPCVQVCRSSLALTQHVLQLM